MHRNFLAFAALSLAACTGEITGDAVVAKPELRQPSLEGDLVSIVIQPDLLELRYDGAVPTFHVGDIVWGTEGSGYLREVTSVDAHGVVVDLKTVDASIDDGFDEIHADSTDATIVPMAPSLPVARDEHLALTGTDGRTYDVQVQYAQPTFTPAESLTTGVAFAWEIPELSITVTDPSGVGRLTLTARSLRVEKALSLEAGLDWSWGHLDELHFIVADDSSYSLQQLSVAIDGSVPLLDQAIPLFDDPALAVVPVGPLVFTLGARIDLGLSAILSGATELHSTSDVSLVTSSRSGVTWDGAFHPVDERSSTFDGDLGPVALGDTHATLSAAVAVLGSVRFALYGVAGPELYGQVTPVAADLTANPQGWHLALAANASGGLRFVLPFVPIDQLDLPFGTWEQTYYQTGGGW